MSPALEDTIRVTLIAAGMQDSPTGRIPVIHFEHSNIASSASLPQNSYERPASPSRNDDNFEQPLAKVQSTAAQPTPIEKTEASSVLPPTRLSTTLARPQRSLDDLRGLRSMGRRHEATHPPQNGLEEENAFDVEEIDVPPFMKKYT